MSIYTSLPSVSGSQNWTNMTNGDNCSFYAAADYHLTANITTCSGRKHMFVCEECMTFIDKL